VSVSIVCDTGATLHDTTQVSDFVMRRRMAARNEMARNLPLASPPKRTKLDIFGSSDASALKASSWHAGTQSRRLCDEIEEMHGRQAFQEDCAMGKCVSAVGSPAGMADSARENASGASPLRRKVVSKDSGVKPYDRDSKPDGCVFEMDMAEEPDSSVASAPANSSTGTESRGPACEQSVQMEGGVFAMDEETAAAAKGTSPQPNPGSDSGDSAMVQEELPELERRSVAQGHPAAYSSTSEAEASALAVLHAMAAGAVASLGDAKTGGADKSSQSRAGTRAAGIGGGKHPQLPVLVKSDGTTMVVSEDMLNKMGIPLAAPATGGTSHTPVLPAVSALALPMESPATKAASGFQGMSLDTPTARTGDASSGKVLTAVGVLTSVQDSGTHTACSTAAQGATDIYIKAGAALGSHVVAALAESISGASGGGEAAVSGNARAGGLNEEELSTADEAAIAALQELGAAGGRWSHEGGGRGGAREAGSGSASSGGTSINSRHGAARGRQVTRSCPGCSERISIACKFCTLCGYMFRQRSHAQPSSNSQVKLLKMSRESVALCYFCTWRAAKHGKPPKDVTRPYTLNPKP